LKKSLTSAVYNTPSVGSKPRKENAAVVKCPECDAEIDLDEDEVEEGEILSCPECDVELEVTQTHPVHVIVISEEEEEEEAGEESDEEEEEGEDEGDLDEMEE
jgi:alpha-aminoadipate/glutamate carrier protein LysW